MKNTAAQIGLIILVVIVLVGLYFFGIKKPQSSQLAPHSVINDYLVEKVVQPNFGGKSFCDYDVLGEEKADVIGPQTIVIKEYVWAYCQEYLVKDGTLTEGTGASLPAVLTLQKDNGEYSLLKYEEAQDGGLDTEFNKALFPANILAKATEYDHTTGDLDPSIEAKKYFANQLTK